MCYDIVSATRAKIKYAIHLGIDPAEIEKFEKELEKLLEHYQPLYHANAFAHPKLMAVTAESRVVPELFEWGLIPGWCKNYVQSREIRSYTANAKIETLFEKPSFRTSARNRRCVLLIDAFYEHFHFEGNVYPFHLQSTLDEPLAVAGIWDEWLNRDTGELIRTVSMITTRANAMMAKIHNNPKLDEPRMPAILRKDQINDWLTSFSNEGDIQRMRLVCEPVSDDFLSAKTVRKLKGRESAGNVSTAEEEFIWPELWFLN